MKCWVNARLDSNTFFLPRRLSNSFSPSELWLTDFFIKILKGSFTLTMFTALTIATSMDAVLALAPWAKEQQMLMFILISLIPKEPSQDQVIDIYFASVNARFWNKDRQTYDTFVKFCTKPLYLQSRIGFEILSKFNYTMSSLAFIRCLWFLDMSALIHRHNMK